jgi:hypothetical protein
LSRGLPSGLRARRAQLEWIPSNAGFGPGNTYFGSGACASPLAVVWPAAASHRFDTAAVGPRCRAVALLGALVSERLGDGARALEHAAGLDEGLLSLSLPILVYS